MIGPELLQEDKMQRVMLTLSILSLTLLSACGETTMDRTLSGAAIGGSLGMIGSAVAGGAILPGLAAGSAVGAATGLITMPSQINLGKPIWEQ
jgi:hypothetical protein